MTDRISHSGDVRQVEYRIPLALFYFRMEDNGGLVEYDIEEKSRSKELGASNLGMKTSCQ